MSDCQCQIPNGGFCQSHKCYKTATWVRYCQTRPNWREAWEQGRGPGQLPKNPELLRPIRVVVHSRGPGTELKAIIAIWQQRFRWFDLSPRKGCGCEDTARWMDRMGPDGCLMNLDAIVDRLDAEAKKRKLSIPFQRFFAARLVRQAIRRARRKSAVEPPRPHATP